MQTCRHYCDDFEGRTGAGPKSYKDGRKFCSICNCAFYAFAPNDIICGCCGSMLRRSRVNKPHEHKYLTLVS